MEDFTRRRAFVVGLDGATFDLVEPWVAAGKLPTFRRLMAEGCWGSLQSVIPPLTMPAWATFLTGLFPGRHGVYSFLRRREGSYDLMPFNGSYVRAPGLAEFSRRHGRRVALVNVPCTYPPRPVDGILVTGLETPGRNVPFTHPQHLGEELIDRFDYEIERDVKYEPGREESFIAAARGVEHKRFEAVLWLMEQVDWDLFAVVFRGTDVVAHALWRFMDPEHPAHEPDQRDLYGEAILREYQEMDRVLAALLEELDAHTTLMIVSDHGFCGVYRDVYIDNALFDAGLIRLQQTLPARLRRSLVRLGLTPAGALRVLSALGLMNPLRRILSGEARVAAKAGLSLQSDVDWSRTRAYSTGGGEIYLNLKDREPQGIVEAGAQYEAVCQQIEAVLRDLRDPGTGETVVGRMWRREEIPGGDAGADMPDLYVEWKDDHYTAMGGIGFGRGVLSQPLRGRSGGHTMRGLFLAHGPDVVTGRKVEGVRLVDVAPTLLYSLGLPVPAGLDGKVRTDIFEPGALPEVSYEETESEEQEVSAFSDDEQAVVEQRLRDLGYI